MSHRVDRRDVWEYRWCRADGASMKPRAPFFGFLRVALFVPRAFLSSLGRACRRHQTTMAGIALIVGVVWVAPIAAAHKRRPMRICILNHTHGSLSHADLSAAIAAVQLQINRDFRLYYFQDRSIDLRIGKSRGWKVIVVNRPIGGGKDAGFHSYNANGTPYARVTIVGADLSSILSHEILEMLEDPFCNKREIVDGLPYYYRINGEQVSDFRLPNNAQDFCSTVDFCY
jgi:hypothetical protein